MAQPRPPFHITIPIYPGVDLLDVAAPVELFSWMAEAWKARATTITLAAEHLTPLKTRDGLTLTPQRQFADYADDAAPQPQTHLLWVPGGAPDVLRKLMRGGPYLDFLKAQSAGADHVSSVCEGALLLAAAGLLDGYRATTHWAFIPCLKQFPAIKVAEGFPRYVIDGNRITGGGISSGLDEALAIVAHVAGQDIAKHVQMITQYFPDPPFEQTIVPATHCPLQA
ncbi:DJ-1/PfpI family protein [Ralstonia pseudosolanacearum]|uniref:DJ-1/PfpI family protein n=1 Tax=Ralstonia pseudosolanacearum TaxID=1310165 RepID=UPI0006BD066B|nr:DJ-1/PfpI family protein [Ralstonia pseudosolanacearum]AKZ26216.1 transcriptional regulator [Ralstonia solanacearum]BCL92263.1 transcriptional regulator [Ralstonia solanacearum]BCL97387.1 transcriptional regulator [Ralstonia solanacearum]BCM12762.1 transcriptional regulator [Ralstonia solanacearum]BCN04828.1 transcriptional regulator [Ralstonia solanacearum]